MQIKTKHRGQKSKFFIGVLLFLVLAFNLSSKCSYGQEEPQGLSPSEIETALGDVKGALDERMKPSGSLYSCRCYAPKYIRGEGYVEQTCDHAEEFKGELLETCKDGFENSLDSFNFEIRARRVMEHYKCDAFKIGDSQHLSAAVKEVTDLYEHALSVTASLVTPDIEVMAAIIAAMERHPMGGPPPAATPEEPKPASPPPSPSPAAPPPTTENPTPSPSDPSSRTPLTPETAPSVEGPSPTNTIVDHAETPGNPDPIPQVTSPVLPMALTGSGCSLNGSDDLTGTSHASWLLICPIFVSLILLRGTRAVRA